MLVTGMTVKVYTIALKLEFCSSTKVVKNYLVLILSVSM